MDFYITGYYWWSAVLSERETGVTLLYDNTSGVIHCPEVTFGGHLLVCNEDLQYLTSLKLIHLFLISWHIVNFCVYSHLCRFLAIEGGKWIQLHGTDKLECSRVCGFAQSSDILRDFRVYFVSRFFFALILLIMHIQTHVYCLSIIWCSFVSLVCHFRFHSRQLFKSQRSRY